MDKTIIGIHGLANKPHRETLEEWWRQSIEEGLQINCKLKKPQFSFKMVYWADLLYKNRQHRDRFFSFDALYNKEPYVSAKKGALKQYKDSWRDDLRAGALNIAGFAIDKLKQQFGMDQFSDWVLGKKLKDLAFYYDDKRKIKNRNKKPEQARKVLQAELNNALVEEKEHVIMLIAHSMGTIIAYDVLRNLGRTKQGVEVSHLVTIGSPLGLPLVKAKIIQDRKYSPQVRTPSIVTKSWINYADRKDPVAIDIHLRDDYSANDKGIRVEDNIVMNDYSINKKSNPHKSYGYLRTPELSKHVKEFLGL